MCKTRNSNRLAIKNKCLPDSIIRIDSCMKNYVDLLNKLGVKTLSCCCGHGKYPMTVVILNEDGNGVYHYVELRSGITLKRVYKFYKKDKDGFYYIPETIGKK